MSDTKKSDGPRMIKSVDRACDILEALQELGGARISELSNYVDISKGTVHTHLATLHENGFVVKTDKTYYTSLRFLEYGTDAKKRNRIYDVGQSDVNELAKETDTRAQLCAEEFGQIVVLHYGHGEHAIDSSIQVGKRDDIHSTAAGKAILAFLDEDRIKTILDKHGLKQRTANTITDREDFWSEIEKIREREFALSDEEQFLGIRSVGAPIHGPTGEVLGSVSVSAPTSGMKDDRFYEKLPEMVLNVANTIEVNIRVQYLDERPEENLVR